MRAWTPAFSGLGRSEDHLLGNGNQAPPVPDVLFLVPSQEPPSPAHQGPLAIQSSHVTRICGFQRLLRSEILPFLGRSPTDSRGGREEEGERGRVGIERE